VARSGRALLLRNYPSIFPEGLKKTKKKLRIYGIAASIFRVQGSTLKTEKHAASIFSVQSSTISH
jgi:hypothetical protein